METIQMIKRASEPNGILQKMAPKSWIPDTTIELTAFMLLATTVHLSFALWPYITVTRWGWVAPWEEGWIAGGWVGLLMTFQFINMVIGASLHRKLCETAKDLPYIMGIAAMGFIMTVAFAQFSKDFLNGISGGAAIWFGGWGLAGVFMMKPGLDHILDIAQPRSRKPCDCTPAEDQDKIAETQSDD